MKNMKLIFKISGLYLILTGFLTFIAFIIVNFIMPKQLFSEYRTLYLFRLTYVVIGFLLLYISSLLNYKENESTGVIKPVIGMYLIITSLYGFIKVYIRLIHKDDLSVIFNRSIYQIYAYTDYNLFYLFLSLIASIFLLRNGLNKTIRLRMVTIYFTSLSFILLVTHYLRTNIAKIDENYRLHPDFNENLILLLSLILIVIVFFQPKEDRIDNQSAALFGGLLLIMSGFQRLIQGLVKMYLKPYPINDFQPHESLYEMSRIELLYWFERYVQLFDIILLIAFGVLMIYFSRIKLSKEKSLRSKILLSYVKLLVVITILFLVLFANQKHVEESKIGQKLMDYKLALQNPNKQQYRLDWNQSVDNSWFPNVIETKDNDFVFLYTGQISKLDTNGISLWEKNTSYKGINVIEDQQGYIYAVGYEEDDYKIAKYDQDGTELFNKKLLSYHELYNSNILMTPLQDGSVMVIGLGSITTTDGSNYYLKLIKINSQGEVINQYHHEFEEGFIDLYLTSMIETTDQSLVISGTIGNYNRFTSHNQTKGYLLSINLADYSQNFEIKYNDTIFEQVIENDQKELIVAGAMSINQDYDAMIVVYNQKGEMTKINTRNLARSYVSNDGFDSYSQIIPIDHEQYKAVGVHYQSTQDVILIHDFDSQFILSYKEQYQHRINRPYIGLVTNDQSIILLNHHDNGYELILKISEKKVQINLLHLVGITMGSVILLSLPTVYHIQSQRKNNIIPQ